MSRGEDPDVQLGILMPAIYAMRAQRFLYERNATREDLASISVQARAHGAHNPYAQFRTPVTVEEVLASRPIADPLTLLQCCPTGDGSAAVVVVSEKVRRRLATVTMKVAASVLHSGTYDPGARPMLFPKITADSANDAYEQASIGPQDIDLVELHDAFTISQLLYYEAMQLCAEGDAVSFQRAGRATHGGSVVVNPSGGLLSRGHPVGATGVAQVVEALWQLRGQGGARQVDDARHAMTHVTGGGLAGFDHGACTVHIFERADAWAA
jgi:benzoylsuccinyl-CoA thiolase BbsB subunit